MFNIDDWLIPADMYYLTLSYKETLTPEECQKKYGSVRMALLTKENFLSMFKDAVEYNTNQIVPSLNEGDFVMYGEEKGRVKEVISNTLVRVVYRCNEDWNNYRDYTAALTSVNKLIKL